MKKIFKESRNDKVQAQLDRRDREENLWPHHPDKLLLTGAEYSVKFYGSTGVYESKGDSAVKSAIQELAYQNNVGNSQAGTIKPPRVFLNISADKVAIRESKIRVEIDRFDISEISYVADDKLAKRVVCLIVCKKNKKSREVGTSLQTNSENKAPFQCYVFESEKHAPEIVRTIAQAFDMSFRNFMSSDKREMQIRNQMILMAEKIKYLEDVNAQFANRMDMLEKLLKVNKISFPARNFASKFSGSSDVKKPQVTVPSVWEASDATPSSSSPEVPSLQPPPYSRSSRNGEAAAAPRSNATNTFNLLDLGIPKVEDNFYSDLYEESSTAQANNQQYEDIDYTDLRGLNFEFITQAPVDVLPSVLSMRSNLYDNPDQLFSPDPMEIDPRISNPDADGQSFTVGTEASPNMPNLLSGIYSNVNGTATNHSTANEQLDALFSEMDSVYHSEMRKQEIAEASQNSEIKRRNEETTTYTDIAPCNSKNIFQTK